MCRLMIPNPSCLRPLKNWLTHYKCAKIASIRGPKSGQQRVDSPWARNLTGPGFSFEKRPAWGGIPLATTGIPLATTGILPRRDKTKNVPFPYINTTKKYYRNICMPGSRSSSRPASHDINMQALISEASLCPNSRRAWYSGYSEACYDFSLGTHT
jgi:hypothetical protein